MDEAFKNPEQRIYLPDQTFARKLFLYLEDKKIELHHFGLVKTLKAVLELDVNTFVHGHGDIASRQDIQAYVDALEMKQNKA